MPLHKFSGKMPESRITLKRIQRIGIIISLHSTKNSYNSPSIPRLLLRLALLNTYTISCSVMGLYNANIGSQFIEVTIAHLKKKYHCGRRILKVTGILHKYKYVQLLL